MPNTPFNSESVELLDELEQPTNRLHHTGFYRYKCEEGYRATVTNPTDSKDGRTGVIQCLKGVLYANGTNPNPSPRQGSNQYANPNQVKQTSVYPYCASISKTKALIVPVGITKIAGFHNSNTKECSKGSAISWRYFKYYENFNIGIYVTEMQNVKKHLMTTYGANKNFNTRFQVRVESSSGSAKVEELSLFLLKDYGNQEECNTNVNSVQKCFQNELPLHEPRKTLRELDINTCLANSGSKRTITSITQSQQESPFASTINTTYSGVTETTLEYGSVAENPADSVAIYECIRSDDCSNIYFGEYWRDWYYIQMGKYKPRESWGRNKDWKGNALPSTSSYFNGVHNMMLTDKYDYYQSIYAAGGTSNSYVPLPAIPDNRHTPTIELPGYDEVTSIAGNGKALDLIMYTDELCHNAWTINVPGADSSWCRENLLVGRSCAPECPTGKKSNKVITCSDPNTFSVTVPDGIECVTDTCPDSPLPGDILNGKVNDCIALQRDGTCNPLCNDGFEASGEITCPGGTTSNTFQCTPPCGASVPHTFDHGGDVNGEPTRKTNIFGDILPQPTFAESNVNPCLLMKPGETCTPTCNSGYMLEGDMKCSSEKDFTNTAVCKSVCNIDKLVPHATNNDCQTKALNPGEYCIVRTKGGYSFPDNTKMAKITCDANGNIIYPPDPKKDCDWGAVTDGSIGHCLPNVKDTILNVQGQCKSGQIVKDIETCIHMYKMIDKHDLKSNWSFAVGTEHLREKGNYTLSTGHTEGNETTLTDTSTRTRAGLFPDWYQDEHDTAPLGCGVSKADGRYSFGFKGRSFRDINTLASVRRLRKRYGWKGIGSSDTYPILTFDLMAKAAYETCRDDIAYLKSEHGIDFPGGFYETNDAWEQYEFLKTFIYWFLSSDDVPVGTQLQSRNEADADQVWYNVKKPEWDQNDLDMIRAREYAYPLTNNFYWSSYSSARKYYYYSRSIFTYGLTGPRYNGKSTEVGHGIGLANSGDGTFTNLYSVLGQSGGHNNYYGENNLYKFPSICNPPMQLNWGETCTPVCKTGYELIGTPQTCSADGTMSAAPECKPITCENQPSNSNWKDVFENGDVSHCDAVARGFTDDEPNGCTPICNTGYKAQGSFGCDTKSSELQDDLKCELKCPELENILSNFNDNGASVSHCNDMNHEEKCEATCSIDGEVPVGDIYCMPRFGCSDTCASAKDGTCDDGGNGAQYATCDLGTDCSDCGPRSPNTVSTARCEKELTIDVAPINGDLDSGCNGVKITESTTCSPTCPEVAPTLDNPFSVKINGEGNAELVRASCSGPCYVSEGLLDQYSDYGTCSVGRLEEGTSCTPTCKSGYIASGTINCINHDTATDNTFKCTPGPCSTQPTSLPDRASVDSVYVEVDSSVEVPCQTGFSSVGMYSCKDNVLSGNPTCVRQCMHFAENDGEETFILDRGSSRTMKCAEGYTSVGIIKC